LEVRDYKPAVLHPRDQCVEADVIGLLRVFHGFVEEKVVSRIKDSKAGLPTRRRHLHVGKKI
jgi:hypothetical protein